MIANLNLKLGWFRAAALGIFDPLGMRAAAIVIIYLCITHVRVFIINIIIMCTSPIY